MKIEEWKDIVGYDGMYMVSNLGRVKSIERIITYSDGRVYKYHEKILKQSVNKGYMKVTLSKNSKVTSKKVHRLVAEAFLSNKNNYPQVNHKDECTTNNNIDNLEWCSQEYNNNYGTRIERIKKKINKEALSFKYKNKNGKKVYQYDNKLKLINVFPTLRECERQGFDRRAIRRCLNKEVNHHKGFIWSLVELEA